MKQFGVFVCIIICLGLTTCSQKQHFDHLPLPPQCQHPVNTLMGSAGKHPTDYGGLTPALSVPFGKTHWSPVNQINNIGQTTYRHGKNTFMGIQATHQPTIWMGDYGYFRVLAKAKNDTATAYPTQPDKQIATPAFYQTQYGNTNHQFAITVAGLAHAAIIEIVPQTNKDSIDIEVEISRMGQFEGEYIAFGPEGKLYATNPDWQSAAFGGKLDPEFKGYLCLKTNGPFALLGAPNIKKSSKLTATLRLKTTKKITLKMGVSFISHKKAEQHINQQINNKTLSQVAAEAQEQYDQLLGRIKLEKPGIINDTIFYTSLYRCMQYPRRITENNEYRSPFNGKVHFGEYYTGFSLWNTYRALHPLLILWMPERINPMVGALAKMYLESGWIPKWPNPAFTNMMIGTHADAVIADAYVKNFKGFNVGEAYKALLKNAFSPPKNDIGNRWANRQTPFQGYEARGGLTHYLEKDYVPADLVNESVSRTVEFSIGDYCIAQMAKKMGHQKDYNMLHNRSLNFVNIFNPQTRFFEPKLSNGQFTKPKYQHYTQGNRWTYRFGAMHNPKKMIELMGGKAAFVAALDSNFDQNHYRHHNQQGHHYPYLYAIANQPLKCHSVVKKQLLKHYRNSPSGLSGNDNCGQMSAWYVFAALGFYPVEPASGRYVVSGPLANKITINLTGNPKKAISIVPLPNQQKNGLIINGQKHIGPYLPHSVFEN